MARGGRSCQSRIVDRMFDSPSSEVEGMTPAQRRPRILEAGTEPATPLERQIERLTARVAALEEEKAALESFAAVAAHELVVPLVMAESYAAIVSDRLKGEAHAESRHYLGALGRGVGRTRLLVETLLHDARSSERPLQRRPVDLNRVVRDVIKMVEPEIVARGARIEAADLPEVLGEEALLSGVFTNLIFNALKYSPRQGGAIRIDVVRELGHWRFRVHSEGPTIALEDRERIFEPFHRARSERRTKGAGLGLAICRRIVERHGGTIGVTAANGSGNTFYFTLPSR
jgi:signal transduction histidine kinase